MSDLLIPEPPLIVLRSLARRIGLNEAIAAQQLHFLTRTYENRVTRSDGRTWFKADLEFWGKQFPFWSEATIKRTFANLKAAKLLFTERGREANAYALDHEAVALVVAQIDPQDHGGNANSAGRTALIDPAPCKGEKKEEKEEEAIGAASGDPTPSLPGLDVPPAPAPKLTAKDRKAQEEAAELPLIEAVWEHHVALFGDRLRIRSLTDPRIRSIRKALRAVGGDAEVLKAASLGLQSYRRANPSGSRDVSIDTIFSTGPHSTRSLTDQIEWWAKQAESDGKSTLPGVPSALQDRINRRRLQVVEMHQKPADTAARERGEEALAWLKEEAHLAPVVEDGRVTSWVKVTA